MGNDVKDACVGDYTSIANSNAIRDSYIHDLNALYISIPDTDDYTMQRIHALFNRLYAYADKLSDTPVMREAPAAEPDSFPSPKDIAVGRECIDRLMRNANSPISCLTSDEAANLLCLFDKAYMATGTPRNEHQEGR